MNPFDLAAIEKIRGYFLLKIAPLESYTPCLKYRANGLKSKTYYSKIDDGGYAIPMSAGQIEQTDLYGALGEHSNLYWPCDKHPSFEQFLSFSTFTIGMASLSGLLSNQPEEFTNDYQNIFLLGFISSLVLLGFGSYKGIMNRTFYKVKLEVTCVITNGEIESGQSTANFIVKGVLSPGIDHSHVPEVNCVAIQVRNGRPIAGAFNFDSGEIFKQHACQQINPQVMFANPTQMAVEPTQSITIIFSETFDITDTQRIVQILALKVDHI